jgi:hypothetical protein
MTDRVWYLAFCVQCNGGIDKLVAGDPSVTPMPFEDQTQRNEWVTAHMDGTDHAVLLMNQHSRTTNDTVSTATTQDTRHSDDRESTVHQTE